ncbi:dienelactone hydrolase family protein-like protein [Aureobasidium subglaciale]|nr:dienelactone hydrolase family protein-like protein [Aureobasidium subglaciale]KAI5270485.1 dienelactone hydrolase family protein-like protein [Aureobasidium subglaciale]
MSTGVGMSSCCLTGKVQEGTPKGHVETIAGLQTYVAEPKDGSKWKTVIFLVDIFGWEFKNTRLLADQYAEKGFTAYIPDVHEGDSLDIEFLQTVEPQKTERDARSLTEKATATAKTGATLGPWLLKHRESVARPLIESFIKQVRMIPGTNKVGVIGFCWGGRYAVLAGDKDFSGAEGMGVDAVYSCHPSLVAIPGDFEGLAVPASFALGDSDSLLGNKEVDQIKELMAKKKSEGIDTEVRVYEDQVHGFALRGDWNSEKDKKAMDESCKQGIDFFNKHLA